VNIGSDYGGRAFNEPIANRAGERSLPLVLAVVRNDTIGRMKLIEVVVACHSDLGKDLVNHLGMLACQCKPAVDAAVRPVVGCLTVKYRGQRSRVACVGCLELNLAKQ